MTVDENNIYLQEAYNTNDESIYYLNARTLKDGTELWRRTERYDSVLLDEFIDGGNFYFMMTEDVVVLDKETGEQEWHFVADEADNSLGTLTTSGIIEDILYIHSLERTYLLDSKTGKNLGEIEWFDNKEYIVEGIFEG